MLWEKLRPCADQVSAALPATTKLSIIFNTRYIGETKKWEVEVTNRTPALSFGVWEVQDATRVVSPRDNVARAIATPGITCDQPVALLATGFTPPRFLTPTIPTPTPSPVPTPAPVVATADEARFRVWVAVYNCYRPSPQSASFAAYRESPQRWTVEGRVGTISYGLWTVDVMTGEITPQDELARQATKDCTTTPTVVTAEQAQTRVWLAIYRCFDPQPAYSSFTAREETPQRQRWVVEGKLVGTGQQPTVYYGLWLVEVNGAKLVPWDILAQDTAARPCYQQP